MTPRETLLAAAEKLERLVAEATPGPWHWEEPSTDPWPDADESLLSANGDTVLYGWGYDASGIHGEAADRELIATMNPLVAAGLAELFRAHSDQDHIWLDETFALAQLVLGGE